MRSRIKLTLTREIDGEYVGEPLFAMYETYWPRETLLLNDRQEYILVVEKLTKMLMDELKNLEIER